MVFIVPPLSSVLSISPPSQIEFQRTLKPLEHQSVETKAYVLFLFFSQSLPMSVGVGSGWQAWHMLAHIGKRVTLIERLPSYRGLPGTSNDRSLLLCSHFTPNSLLFDCATGTFVFTPHLILFCFSVYVPIFISCLESDKKVKHLVSVRKHLVSFLYGREILFASALHQIDSFAL